MKYNKKYFESQFENYDSIYGNGWGMNWRAYMKLRAQDSLDEVVKYITSHDSVTILEIGCASGDFTSRYIETGMEYKIIGADISELAVDICKKRFRNYKNASFVSMNFPNIGMKNIDCIICMDVLEYFDRHDKKECLSAMKEAMSDNGTIICQLPLLEEDENAFVDMFSNVFQVDVKRFVYGSIWYKCFEQWLVMMVNVFLVGKKFGFVGKVIGKLAFGICNSDKVVSFWFKVNEKLFSEKKSHIVLVGRKV